MSLTNIWHLRRVADTAAKSCYVCYKPSSSVLITPDNKDFFYVCTVHLQDRHFCSPIVDAEEAEEKKKQEALAREIEKVKKEYEEKLQRKKEKEKEKDNKSKDESKDKDKDKKDDQSKKTDKEGSDADEDGDEKMKSPSSHDTPRIFALHKNFYQMRIDRLRNIEVAKRNRQRMQDPSLFPSAPSGAP